MARWHYEQGGGDDLQPAAAMRMPIPRRPTFTEAIGRPLPPPPDDAA